MNVYLIVYIAVAFITFIGKLVYLGDKIRDTEVITKQAANYAIFWPLYLVRWVLNIFLPY